MAFLFGGTFLLILLVIHVIFAFPIYVMAQKTGQENPWFAFIPILNLVTLLNIAGKELWWIILLLIPFVNIVVSVIVWMAVAEAMDKPSWVGILMLVPFANIVVPFYLAFA